MEGHYAVAKLVEDHRSEEKDAGDEAKRPVLRRAPCGMLLGELSGQRIGDEREDQKPARMQIDGDAKGATHSEAGARCHRAAPIIAEPEPPIAETNLFDTCNSNPLNAKF